MTAGATNRKEQEPERAAAPREGAFFDLDKTLLPGAALFPVAREMYRQGAVTTGDILRIASDQIADRVSGKEDKERMTRGRGTTLAPGKGQHPEEGAKLGRLVAGRGLLPPLYPPAA